MNEKFNQIVGAFKMKGCRITEQRKQLVDIILKNPGCSCKELYYLARRNDGEIGRATVYRTVHFLEDLGLVKKDNVVIS